MSIKQLGPHANRPDDVVRLDELQQAIQTAINAIRPVYMLLGATLFPTNVPLPLGAKAVDVVTIAGGSGGQGGAWSATPITAAKDGGVGAPGGGISFQSFDLTKQPTATALIVAVGRGGSGGAGATATTAAQPGTSGQETSVALSGVPAPNVICRSLGGNRGADSGGSGLIWAAPGPKQGTKYWTPAGTDAERISGAPAGGGGGGYTALAALVPAGRGVPGGGTAANQYTAVDTNGQDVVFGNVAAGASGGGGSASVSGSGSPGGNGGKYGAGGGGGGAGAGAGNSGGKGGQGADGVAFLRFTF